MLSVAAAHGAAAGEQAAQPHKHLNRESVTAMLLLKDATQVRNTTFCLVMLFLCTAWQHACGHDAVTENVHHAQQKLSECSAVYVLLHLRALSSTKRRLRCEDVVWH
jgi:hypothetical protein